MSLSTFAAFLPALTREPQPPVDPTGKLLASVALHRYGAVMTVNQNTDTLGTNKYPSEFWAMQYNIKPTAFVSRYMGADNTLTNFGRVEKSIYFQTDRWQHPSTGTIGLIPDYNSTTWSSAGAAVFNVTAGQAKPDRYPNHGQQLYDVSGGVYGWDSVQGAGTNNLAELTGLIDAEKSQYSEAPFAFSYRNGRNDTPEVYAPYFLGGRNSFFSTSGDANTSYGSGAGLPNNKTARLDYVDRASATRYADFTSGVASIGVESGGTATDRDNYLAQELLKTVQSKGFFQDFMHWHTAGTLVRDMYRLTRSTLLGQDVHFAGYEEALRYLWARQSVQSVTVEGTTVSLVWKAFDLPEALTIPVSIRIDTTGTDLAGKHLASSVGQVLRKSANVFVVEVPYGTSSFTVSETASPVYIDLGVPAIGFELSGTTLTVTCDKPCRVALWKAATGTAESSLGAPVRSTAYQTVHTFTLTSTEAAGDLYVGALSERGQSAVVKVGEAPPNNLLFSDNLEGSSYLSGWNIQNGGTAYAIQHQAAPGGGKALRFELRAGDPPNNSGTRTEVYYPERLEEAWYSFRVYFPSAEYADETGTSRESIAQWHQGGGSGSPYNMLLIQQGRFWLFLDNDAGRNIRLDIGSQVKDFWHTFVFYTRFSEFAEGHIKCWHNGTLVADETGPNLAAGFSLPEVKLGIYKWDWNNSGTTTTDKRVMWLDEVKIGNKDATYAQMAGQT